MESSYLPDILDHTLRGYVAFYGLTSWKIYGGLYNKATVILRFGSANLDEQEQSHQDTYRKKPPSATDQDRSRMQQFKEARSIHSNMQNVNMDNIVEFTPGAVVHGDQSALESDVEMPPLPSLPQVDGQCDTGCKKTSTFVYKETHVSDQDVVDNTFEGKSETESVVITQEDVTDRDMPSDAQMEESSDDSDEEDSSIDDSELIKCRYCNCILGQGVDQWYKCTDCCTAQGHFDLCITCYDAKNHLDHVDSMSLFKNPTQGNQYYCDSCGYEFSSKDRKYECKECKETEDGCFLFEMCRICFNKGYHRVHHDQLRRVRDKVS